MIQKGSSTIVGSAVPAKVPVPLSQHAPFFSRELFQDRQRVASFFYVMDACDLDRLLGHRMKQDRQPPCHSAIERPLADEMLDKSFTRDSNADRTAKTLKFGQPNDDLAIVDRL